MTPQTKPRKKSKKATPPPTPKGTKVPSAQDKDPKNKWGLNKSPGKATHGTLNNAEQGKFDTFQNAIHKEGLHPREAAAKLGKGTDYKRLEGQPASQNIHQIRLSKDQRATFTVDDENKMVHLHQVGGHT